MVQVSTLVVIEIRMKNIANSTDSDDLSVETNVHFGLCRHLLLLISNRDKISEMFKIRLSLFS